MRRRIRSILTASVILIATTIGFLWNFHSEASTLISSKAKLKQSSVKLTRSVSFEQRIGTLKEKAQKKKSVRVIVRVRAPFQPEGKITNRADRLAQRSLIKDAQDDLLGSLKYFPGSLKRFDDVPYVSMAVDVEGLSQLQSSSEVLDVSEDKVMRFAIAESIALIGAPNAWAAGYSGAGQNVAILDTGVDKNHPLLTYDNGISKVVSEACYSTTDTTIGIPSLCPGGAKSSTTINSGLPCDAEFAGCDHGTQVAGTAAGETGVATSANIISIKVASLVVDDGHCATGCVRAYTSDVMSGLSRVKELRTSFNIAAVNIGLSTERPDLFTTNCDDREFAIPMKAMIDELRSYGIAVIAPSGNDRSSTEVGFPACISSVISVGASNDGTEESSSVVDTVWKDSNISSFLTLLAPGARIVAPIPGTNVTDVRQGYGTSLASAHVAGAWALLKQAFPFTDTETETVWFDDALPAGAVPNIDIIEGEQRVSFKNVKGYYFTAMNGGGWEVNVYKKSIAAEEKFKLIDLNGGTLVSGDSIQLLASDGLHFVSAHGGGAPRWTELPAGRVFANKTLPGSTETFVIRKVDGSTGTIGTDTQVSIQSSGGYYFWSDEWYQDEPIYAPPLGQLFANSTTVGSNETFTFNTYETNADGTRVITLKGSGGFYVSAKNGNGYDVNVDAVSAGGWEAFSLVDMNGGQLESGDQVRFRKDSGAFDGIYYLSIYGGGAAKGTPPPIGRAYVNAHTASTNETFILRKADGSSGIISDGASVSVQTENGYYFCAEGGGIAEGATSPLGQLFANDPYVGGYDDVFNIEMTTIPGSGSRETWHWITSNPAPHSGTNSHQSSIATNIKQHSFSGATQTMQVKVGDSLFAWVYLDPLNIPSEIMLEWKEGSSWEHRAYWGANNINFGVGGTESRRYVGELPSAGEWVKLEVPASLVGLEGKIVHGIAFTQFGGRVTWDKTGTLSGRVSDIPTLLSRLKNSGLKITDTRNNITNGATISRIRVDAAVNHDLNVPIDHWKGEYFNNKTLSNNPSMVRNDGAGNIEFDFGLERPCSTCGIGSDNYSIRWSRKVNFTTAGKYRFLVNANDGVRLYVDGTQVIDKWINQDNAVNHFATVDLAAGNHDIVFEYYENTGAAQVSLKWTNSCFSNVEQGNWKGEYYDKPEFSGNLGLVRDYGKSLGIDFRGESPDSFCGILAQDFSARFTRTVSEQDMPAGLYRFKVKVDDGVRLKVDGDLIINEWRNQGATEYTALKTLGTGTHTIEVEYYQATGPSEIQVSWERPCHPGVSSDNWKGEYFKNTTLSGEPALIRDDGTGYIDMNFSGRSPGTDFCNQYNNIDSTNYSVRWMRTLRNIPAGKYRFSVTGTYGFKLYIDNLEVINSWNVTAPNTRSLNYDKTFAISGDHTIRFEYFQGSDSTTAHARLIWGRFESTCELPPPAEATNNWKGEYFNNQFLSGSPVMVTDEGENDIQRNWGGDSPSSACSVYPDYFSVRWTRRVHLNAGVYHFSTWADNGIRLFVKNLRTNQEKLVIDRWSNTVANDESLPVDLSNDDYELRLELFETWGGAGVTLSWYQELNAPSSLAASAAGADKINLTWTDNNTFEHGFKIERWAGSNWSQIATVGPNATSYTDSSLYPFTTYTYRVRTYTTNAADSGYSNESSATTWRPIPAAPSNLSLSMQRNQGDRYWSSKLDWTNNSPYVDGFRIDYRLTNLSTDQTSDWIRLGGVDGNTTTYTAKSLPWFHIIEFRVRAYNSTGFSESSNTVIARTPCERPGTCN